jgi:ribonuclease HI
MIIILCDGCSKGNGGESSVGALIWQRTKTNKHRVTPIHRISEPIGQATNNEAEWMAVIRSMEYIKNLSDNHIFIYSDSQLVVNQIMGFYKTKEQKMKDLKKYFISLCLNKTVNAYWIPRQLTCLADKEANKVFK